MNRSQFAFKLIDVFFYPLQNGVHFENIKEIRDVDYVPGGGTSRSGNIYFDKTLAAKGRKFPVIAYIHGGGFLMGDKNYRKSVCEYYAHNGYFVWDVNYRMPPEIVFPEILYDCVDGLNYLNELAKEYDIDLDKVVVTGDSSGGYLATYATAIACDDELRESLGSPEVKVKIAALAPFCGIYDVNVLLKQHMPLDMIQQVTGMLIGMHVDHDKKNIVESPWFNFLSPGAFINDKWPPAYIVWSEKDLLCAGQGPHMAELLKAHCPVVETDSAPELWNNHCYHLLWRTSAARKCMTKFLRFLKEQGLR
ncbi:MAG: alpha/beta hydrolase [Clostridia bacterium]|nr:alpha/beta hydrolase [Clostridia bacterium]